MSNPFVSSPLVRDVDTIVDVMDTQQPSVASHCRRVAAYGVQLASQYGLPEEMVETIRVGGLLHDVGKMMVAPDILTKPGRLTEQEWRALQNHPEYGFDMAERLGFESSILDIILYHHERNDSSGYPDGLNGHSIPWTVRIISVMDAFDALTSPRAYRAALSIDAARALLAREAYCPWVVSGLMSIPNSALEAVAAGTYEIGRPDSRPTERVVESATTPWTPTYREDPGVLTTWEAHRPTPEARP
jgi:putative nucleotidyltransferase with HDIG domain